jgi:hypothetical protein
MLKAIEYEILRGVKASGMIKIPLPRQPVRVATLINEEEFNRDQFMVHHKSVFLEDKMHDWDWRAGEFRYYTRIAEEADVLVVYKIEDVQPVARFDPMTGKKLI